MSYLYTTSGTPEFMKQLQEKYGVYRTGIRIMFDTVTTEKNDKGDIVNKSVISVQDKGGTAPASKDSVKRVLIEVNIFSFLSIKPFTPNYPLKTAHHQPLE